MIFALDPSLSCSGFAVLAADGSAIDVYGKIKPDSKGDAYERAADIASLCLLELRKYRGQLTAVVIEAPRTNSRGLGGKRSAASLPNYGICIGVVTYAVEREIGTWSPAPALLRPSASDWTRGVTGTKGDTHKERRVRAAEEKFGLSEGAFGCKTDAGNIADAILLGCWAAGKVRAA